MKYHQPESLTGAQARLLLQGLIDGGLGCESALLLSTLNLTIY